jgi:Carboxypeptidase regulatory-like domain
MLKHVRTLISQFFVCTGIYFALNALAWGQATTSLRGTVTDPSGAAVPKASVTLTNVDVNTPRTTRTGPQGDYSFVSLPPGTYQLVIETPGFERYQQTNLQLLVNTPATVNVQLKLGSVNETVAVTAEAPVLNSADASIGNAFSNTQVKQIPLEGRNVPDLLSLQAGVVYTGNRPDQDRDYDTRSGSVNGARSDQSNVTLDGVDVNDQANGYAFTSVLPTTLDSVQEFRVTTTNYNSDQGRSSGAQVSLVTKSGTDSFHGSLYEYLRNTYTSANDYFVKLAEITSGQPNKPPKLNRNIFGASLGGPIKKQRLFFFFNYEGTRQREENSVVDTIPSATLRQGIIQYQNANGGITVLTPQDIKALDPLHIGPNPVMLNYFNTFPLPNDNSVGDGFNYSGYRFAAPVRNDNDVYIARFDYRLDQNGKHTLFWRGALQDRYNPGAPFLPGTTPEHTIVDHSKGFAIGYTAVLTPALVNNLRYGLTRQSVGNAGDSTQAWNQFRGLVDNTNNRQGITYSTAFQMPVHNILDDLSWTKNAHTMQFGTNLGFVRNPRVSSLNSYSYGLGNAAWLDTGGFANTNSPLDPFVGSNGALPEIDPAFNNSYDFPMTALLGMVTEVNANYNYLKDGSLLPQGAPVQRHFALDWYEFYAQDSWRIKPNLTLTYGLRWSLFPPPWETKGLQVAPTVSLGGLLAQNAQFMQYGIPANVDPTITFNLAGPANNGPGYYHFEKNDIAPRLAIAWSLRPESSWGKKLFGDNDKTVIRAGFSKVYDRFGMGLLNTFDQNGAFGLATAIGNPAGIESASTAPRLTDLHTIPTTDYAGNTLFIPAPPGAFPQTPPTTVDGGGFAIAWGLDNTIRTPYSYTFDVSVGRELPKQFALEVAYVGRLSRNLLTQRDVMQPLNLVDKKSGIDYFTAATRLSQLYRQGIPTSQINASSVGATSKYWKDMIQPLKAGGAYSLTCSGGSTTNVIQAVYDVYSCYPANDTSALAIIDAFGGISDANLSNVSYGPVTGPFSYFNRQYSSLYTWSSIGPANYNALEVTLRKRFTAGLQFDLNYTFSKSMDISSDAERIVPWGGLGGLVVNAFSPNQLRGVSDFDTPHQINANWIIELPFGRGKPLARNAGAFLDAFIGGWQLSGIARWTSGFPVNVDNGYFFPTDWQIEGNALTIATPKSGAYKMPDGTVSMFANGTAAISDFIHPFPGASGSRNTFRGDGFAGWDMGLSKRWKLPIEGHGLQLRWEVFNVPNLTRFDVAPLASRPEIDISSSFGNYTNLLTSPRVMQFALRYEF